MMRRFKIELSCGCRTWGRNIPLPHTKMVCDSGLGHGSGKRWVQAVDRENGKVCTNIDQGK